MNSTDTGGARHIDKSISSEVLARHFKEWYGHRHGHSEVYETIVGELINDEALLGLAAEAGGREYLHYLFMAAVHYLLLEGVSHPVAAYYGTVVEKPRPASEVYPYFRDFCFREKNSILALIANRQVQINEVRRCIPLVLSLSQVTDGDEAPLALVDIGAAAGLNLLVDRFCYDFGSAGFLGHPDAALRLACECRGALLPPVPDRIPRIAWRLGIDCQPIDVTDSHQTNWLIALCAPDDSGRLTVLQKAVEVARRYPPEIVVGTASEALPETISRVPVNLTLFLVHSFTTHHFSSQERIRYDEILTGLGRTRNFHEVSLEWERLANGAPDFSKPVPLKLRSFRRRCRTETVLGTVDSRGACEWIEWQR